jgi:hypothetical protein
MTGCRLGSSSKSMRTGSRWRHVQGSSPRPSFMSGSSMDQSGGKRRGSVTKPRQTRRAAQRSSSRRKNALAASAGAAQAGNNRHRGNLALRCSGGGELTAAEAATWIWRWRRPEMGTTNIDGRHTSARPRRPARSPVLMVQFARGKPSSVPAPAGSRTTSNWRIGPSGEQFDAMCRCFVAVVADEALGISAMGSQEGVTPRPHREADTSRQVAVNRRSDKSKARASETVGSPIRRPTAVGLLKPFSMLLSFSACVVRSLTI